MKGGKASKNGGNGTDLIKDGGEIAERKLSNFFLGVLKEEKNIKV